MIETTGNDRLRTAINRARDAGMATDTIRAVIAEELRLVEWGTYSAAFEQWITEGGSLPEMPPTVAEYLQPVNQFVSRYNAEG